MYFCTITASATNKWLSYVGFSTRLRHFSCFLVLVQKFYAKLNYCHSEHTLLSCQPPWKNLNKAKRVATSSSYSFLPVSAYFRMLSILKPSRPKFLRFLAFSECSKSSSSIISHSLKHNSIF